MARHDGRGKVSGAAGDAGSRFSSQFHWASRGQSRFCFLTASRAKPKQRQFFSFKMDRALFPIFLHSGGF